VARRARTGIAAGGSPPAAAAPAAAAEVKRFAVGELQAMAIRDGGASVPNDNKIFGVGRTPEEVAAVLAAAGAPTDQLALSIQTLLVRVGDRLVMFDSGGGPSYPGAGKLTASLDRRASPRPRSPISSYRTRTATTSADS
jgi:hypothetical protein